MGLYVHPKNEIYNIEEFGYLICKKFRINSAESYVKTSIVEHIKGFRTPIVVNITEVGTSIIVHITEVCTPIVVYIAGKKIVRLYPSSYLYHDYRFLIMSIRLRASHSTSVVIANDFSRNAP